MAISKKLKSAYFCSQCGAEHPKWQGQCKECNAWNSLLEEKVTTKKGTSTKITDSIKKRIPEIEMSRSFGYKSGIDEFDRVLGGHLLPGMTILLGGEPGIGKSTLILQAAEAYSKLGLQVLYVTGEESLSQLKLRSNRLEVIGENVTAINTTSLEEIYQLRVSAHCLIRRDGKIIQYVSFNDRAWHAGVSTYNSKSKCNDFSIGIELEGADDIPYTDEQYQQLSQLTLSLISVYPLIEGNITGHCDIAPGRKTDPGGAFDWHKYQKMIQINKAV